MAEPLTMAAMCLALNIYFEARDQSLAGQIAVSNVVINRVEDPRYPNTVCGVVKDAKLDYRGQPKRNKCQFSWYCDGKSDKPKEGAYWDQASALANHLLSNKVYWDITEGATHYHAYYVNPSWNVDMEKTVTIDDHIFYRSEPNR